MEKWELAYEDYKQGMKYKDIASKYGVSLNTVKSWKTRKWNEDAPVKKSVHTKKECAHKKEKGAANDSVDTLKKKGGNPNPKNQFTKRNQAARIHGLRSKYFTETQREIMDDFQDFNIADQLWMQIEIKFSAIIQLQKVMWVEDADDHLKEESGSSWGEGGSSESFKIAFAYERYEAYIKAQTRAMAEYRNLTKQFLELAHANDERCLKLESMQLDIDKKQEELKALKDDGGDNDKPIEIVIKRKGART